MKYCFYFLKIVIRNDSLLNGQMKYPTEKKLGGSWIRTHDLEITMQMFYHKRKSFLKTFYLFFRNCLIGGSFQVKISDSAIYRPVYASGGNLIKHFSSQPK